MRKIDISNYDVIKAGIEFKTQVSAQQHCKLQAPDVNSLLPHMERNESYVYWLQPKLGNMHNQEACICVDGQFYMLNGKLEKAIFRNVRLTRDFQNFERLVDGTCKLVIPRRLMQEKLRTSKRVCKVMLYLCAALLDAAQHMFMMTCFLYFTELYAHETAQRTSNCQIPIYE